MAKKQIIGGLRRHQRSKPDDPQQSKRFIESAREVEADESEKGDDRAFKKVVVGSFHKVSAKYLPLYVAEFQFRYNNRFNDDIFGMAIEGA